MVAWIVFWISGLLIAHVYFGYPLFLYVLAKLRPRPVGKRSIEPFVSLLVPAYNEENAVAEKIRSSLELDYPADKLEIVVASDGSSDRTAERARAFENDPRVRVIDYPVNRGKVAVLNETIPTLKGEIVALTDATTVIEPGALRELVANFADPEVGAVSSRYGVRDSAASGLGRRESFYWRYETLLKELEGRVGSTIGAHGALYALRKELYPYPETTILNDDHVIPIRIIAQGRRMAYEPKAPAFEAAHEMTGFARRVRNTTGNLFQMRELGRLLRPLRPLAAFCFLSRKGGRLIVPLALPALLAASLFLLDSPFVRVVLGLQGVFYGLALMGTVIKSSRLFSVPYFFCMVNASAYPAYYYATLGRGKLVWRE